MKFQLLTSAVFVLVALVAGCGGSSPDEESPKILDDVRASNADPGGESTANNLGKGANSPAPTGDGGTLSREWDGFRLPTPFPPLASRLVLDADAGGE